MNFFRWTKLHEPIQLGFWLCVVSRLFNKFSYSFDLSNSIHEQSYPFTVSSKSEPKFWKTHRGITYAQGGRTKLVLQKYLSMAQGTFVVMEDSSGSLSRGMLLSFLINRVALLPEVI